MRDTDPPNTRALLTRVAAILDVAPSVFSSAGGRPTAERDATPAECEEAMVLFRRIEEPSRRAAALRLLREMGAKR